MDYSKQYKVLHSEFDISTHKETFINYLEVIIKPTGKVEYALPGHSEKLVSIGMEKTHLSRRDFINLLPRERMCEWIEWLCEVTGCISVWNDMYVGKANRFQKHKLQELQAAGLYNGFIH